MLQVSYLVKIKTNPHCYDKQIIDKYKIKRGPHTLTELSAAADKHFKIKNPRMCFYPYEIILLGVIPLVSEGDFI